MLKRNGEIPGSIVPGSTVRLTTGQFNAYTAAFATIQPEFDEMRQMQRQLKRFPEMTSNRHADSDDGAVTIVAAGIEWQAQAQLLKLPKSAIFLCRQRTGNECAIIQRFSPESAYAKANGQDEILSRGIDPRPLVGEYAALVQHTLRFTASNLVAKAQRVAFEQFSEHRPGKVVRAISERCLLAVGESLTLAESVREAIPQRRGLRI
jgi:hypothetical protein